MKKALKDDSLNLDEQGNGFRNFEKLREQLIGDNPDFARFFEVGKCHHKFKDFSKTKILIVGTISPWNSPDFFYSAPKTKMYAVIDKLLGTKFDELKEKGDFVTLQEQLEENGISFLDVFDRVIRRKASASDSDIIFASLNYEDFDAYMPKLPEKAVVAADSKLAFEKCEIILSQVQNGNYLNRLEAKSCSIFRHSVDVMADEWKDVFRKADFEIE